MSELWVDDFAADHFVDRYRLLAGSKGTHEGDGSFYVADGLHPHYCAWNDENAAVGDSLASWMELDLLDFSIRSLTLRMGFVPPGQAVGQPPFTGVWAQLNFSWLGGGHAGMNVRICDDAPWVELAEFGSAAVAIVSDLSGIPRLPIVARLAIDTAGIAYFTVATNTGPFTGGYPLTFGTAGGSAIGGFGQISEPSLAELPGWVPAVYIAAGDLASGAPSPTIGLWKYETGIAREFGTPGSLSVAAGNSGIVRQGPPPATPGLRSSFA